MTTRNILLVEDDQVDVIMLERALKRISIKYHLSIIENGIDAINYMKNLQKNQIPDFIFLDLNLPRLNGFEILESLKKKCDIKNMNIYIMTTSKDPKDIAKAKEYNVSGYIVKSINFKDFLKSVENIFNTLPN